MSLKLAKMLHDLIQTLRVDCKNATQIWIQLSATQDLSGDLSGWFWHATFEWTHLDLRERFCVLATTVFSVWIQLVKYTQPKTVFVQSVVNVQCLIVIWWSIWLQCQQQRVHVNNVINTRPDTEPSWIKCTMRVNQRLKHSSAVSSPLHVYQLDNEILLRRERF